MNFDTIGVCRNLFLGGAKHLLGGGGGLKRETYTLKRKFWNRTPQTWTQIVISTCFSATERSSSWKVDWAKKRREMIVIPLQTSLKRTISITWKVIYVLVYTWERSPTKVWERQLSARGWGLNTPCSLLQMTHGKAFSPKVGGGSSSTIWLPLKWSL